MRAGKIVLNAHTISSNRKIRRDISMKRFSKAVTLLLAAAMLMSVFAACGKKGADPAVCSWTFWIPQDPSGITLSTTRFRPYPIPMNMRA